MTVINWGQVEWLRCQLPLRSEPGRSPKLARGIALELGNFPDAWNKPALARDGAHEAHRTANYAQLLCERFDESADSYEAMLILSQALFNAGTRLWVLGRCIEACEVLGLGLEYARRVEDPLQEANVLRRFGRPLHHSGQLFRAKGAFKASEAICLESANIDAQKMLAYVWDELARLCLSRFKMSHDKKFLAKAKQYIMMARNKLVEIGDAPHEHAISKRGYANILRMDDQPESALLLLKEALIDIEVFYGETHTQAGITFRAIALTFWAMGEYKEASEMFEAANDILKTSLAPNHPDKAITLILWADMLEEMGHRAGSMFAKANALRAQANTLRIEADSMLEEERGAGRCLVIHD